MVIHHLNSDLVLYTSDLMCIIYGVFVMFWAVTRINGLQCVEGEAVERIDSAANCVGLWDFGAMGRGKGAAGTRGWVGWRW